jgi:D-alanyl-D-alanine dipeptidase
MRLNRFVFLIFLGFFLSGIPQEGSCSDQIPNEFIDIERAIPGIILDIRYFGSHNFMGEKVDGYLAPKCYLTRKSVEALVKVQNELSKSGLSLKIYDCYRPQRAVNHFVRWAKDLDNIKTKQEFYPTVDKRNLFKEGYIDARSGHSRGSTVDLTIVPQNAPAQEIYVPGQPLMECYRPAKERYKDNGIDMGTGFDCFHVLSHTDSSAISVEQKANRNLLKSLMSKYGFRNYKKEWWHYTLIDEPFPDTYFDFLIQ